VTASDLEWPAFDAPLPPHPPFRRPCASVVTYEEILGRAADVPTDGLPIDSAPFEGKDGAVTAAAFRRGRPLCRVRIPVGGTIGRAGSQPMTTVVHGDHGPLTRSGPRHPRRASAVPQVAEGDGPWCEGRWTTSRPTSSTANPLGGDLVAHPSHPSSGSSTTPPTSRAACRRRDRTADGALDGTSPKVTRSAVPRCGPGPPRIGGVEELALIATADRHTA
jgi:hypothetical protein